MLALFTRLFRAKSRNLLVFSARVSRLRSKRTALVALALAALFATPAHATRVKDLGTFQGLRTNQLTGYGIVVGLAGTGDDSLEYATLGMKGVTSRFGLALPPGINPALKNAAAVMITAELPAFAKPGQRLDITVSALGKAKSIRGGTLLMTPLIGADNAIYAMAQGNVAVGGLGVEGNDGSKLSVNIPSAGRIPGGATVERAVDAGFANSPQLVFNLAESDLTTAQRVAQAIAGTGIAARAIDAVSIAIDAPAGAETRATLMSRIENLEVTRRCARARDRQCANRHGRDQRRRADQSGGGQPRQAHRGRQGKPARRAAGAVCTARADGDRGGLDHQCQRGRQPDVRLHGRLARGHRQGRERDRRRAVGSGRDPGGAEAGRAP
jgi:hypothetical protein